jgi:hypothetical protein
MESAQDVATMQPQDEQAGSPMHIVAWVDGSIHMIQEALPMDAAFCGDAVSATLQRIIASQVYLLIFDEEKVTDFGLVSSEMANAIFEDKSHWAAGESNIMPAWRLINDLLDEDEFDESRAVINLIFIASQLGDKAEFLEMLQRDESDSTYIICLMGSLFHEANMPTSYDLAAAQNPKRIKVINCNGLTTNGIGDAVAALLG